MSRLREHKSFCEIEQDIKLYYENGTISAVDTALKIAGRALSVALAAYPERVGTLTELRQQVFDLILERVA